MSFGWEVLLLVDDVQLVIDICITSFSGIGSVGDQTNCQSYKTNISCIEFDSAFTIMIEISPEFLTLQCVD